MKMLMLAWLVLATVQPSWTQFHSPEGGFTVSMPGAPRQWVQRVQTPDGPKEAHLVVARLRGGTQDWLVSYRDLPSTATHISDDHLLEGIQSLMVNSMHARLVKSRKVALQGCPGREWILTEANGAVVWERIVLANGRVYQVVVSAPVGQMPAGEVGRFMHSFKLVAAQR